jgi:Flp pilus assembly protein CpaB
MSLTAPAPSRSTSRPEPPTTAGPAAAGRALGRRPAVPAGRAIIGGLLVTLAAVGTFAAYTAGTTGPSHRYVVARDPLAVGTVLHAEDLRIVAGDLPDDVAVEAFTDPGALEGAVALAPLAANQLVAPSQVRIAAVADARGPTHELAVAFERDKALDGRIQPGERVDLVTTYGTGTDAYTTVVARRTPVLDVDSGARSTVGSSTKVTLTLALASELEVLEVAHAVEVGKVVVVRATGLDDPATAEAGATAGTGAASGSGPEAGVFQPAGPGRGSAAGRSSGPGGSGSGVGGSTVTTTTTRASAGTPGGAP